jgi:hypothetical protein
MSKKALANAEKALKALKIKNGRSGRKNKPRIQNSVRNIEKIAKFVPTPRNPVMNVENIVSAMEHTPRTLAGASFIRFALNPCGEDPLPSLLGIPDSSGSDSTPLVFRDDWMFDTPTSLMESELATIVVFSTPYFHVHYIVVRFFDSGPNDSQLRDCINALTSLQQDTLARYPNWFSPTSVFAPGGLTLTPYTGPPFEITFCVPAALQTFTSSIVPGSQSNSWSWFRKFRFVGKGATMHLNAPGLANQGRVISAATSTESSVKNLQITGGIAPIAARYTVSPPFQDNILAMQDANAHQDLAKKGEYTIQRHCNDSIIWNEAEDVRAIWRVSSSASAGTIAENSIITNTGFAKIDGFDMNLGWIVQHVRGLSQSAALHVKSRSMISVNVPGTSPWSPALKAVLTKDAPALVLYRELSSKLPHSFVSDYNDWGLLSKTITSTIAKVAAPLARSGLKSGFNVLNGFIDRIEGVESIAFNSSRGGYGDRRFGSN